MPDTALKTNPQAKQRDINATIDGLKLRVLRAVPRNDWYCSLARLTHKTEIPREICRGIIAELRAEGLVTYRKGLMNEDGDLGGTGYTLTKKGEAKIEEGE
ncbi:hypothetical protein [Pararhodobacter sp. CCB-MM2]|uniref:hypothetical protein n=1 Tax=Pararhodobacter sp. CCB-MM2 TaxID=1786003 RepID=UPI00082B1AE6|nr:hypothetical protein [Pararhodobacter sp. CCB-MM2]